MDDYKLPGGGDAASSSQARFDASSDRIVRPACGDQNDKAKVQPSGPSLDPISQFEAAFHADGMHCHGCEHAIEASVAKLDGVKKVKADYPTEIVTVVFDPDAITLGDIRARVEQAGYRTHLLDGSKSRRSPLWKFAALVVGVAGILAIIFFDTEWISQGGAPDISQHMSLGLIFLLGLLTGFHCVGMCGGFVLSYTADAASEGRRSYLGHLLYGGGKTLSYTTLGATFGFVGAFVTFTPLLRGVAGILAGGFLIAFGLNMLGLFAPLRRFRFGLPAPLQRFLDRQSRTPHQPFVIGLLNGLMIACGPLQAMYVMAAGTGSALEGAKMLFAFGIGTLPVMLSFGMLTTLVSGSLTHRLLKASGVIVVVLGAVMINRGLILTGSGYDLRSMAANLRGTAVLLQTSPSSPSLHSQEEGPSAAQTVATSQARPIAQPHSSFQTIEMDVIASGYAPNHFVLIRGVPVRWVINGKNVTSCNHRIVVPALSLEFDVKPGPQTIEFTPDKVGVIPWSCWMGMLHGDFEVVEAGAVTATATPKASPHSAVGPSMDVNEKAASDQAKSPSPLVREDSYTVVPGDSLSRIATKLYKKSARWRAIAAANLDVDPNRLRPGQVIRLPENSKKPVDW